MQLHAQQNHIETVLRGKQVQYEMIDIASDPAYREEMRQRCGDETALAPQIFSGDFHCGVSTLLSSLTFPLRREYTFVVTDFSTEA